MNHNARNERVFNAMLTVALEDFLDKDIEAVRASISDSKTEPCSDNHTRRMVRLVRRSKRKPGRTGRWLKRTAIVFLAVSTLMFASALSVEAVRDVIRAKLADSSIGRVLELHRDQTPEPVKKPSFTLGFLPDGYTEVFKEEIMGGSTTAYSKEGEPDIAFSQHPADADIRHDIGDGTREYSQFKMNGVTVHVYKALEPTDKSFLIWYDGDYRFGLDSALPVDELLKIAENIR